jgi:hypothetical protein
MASSNEVVHKLWADIQDAAQNCDMEELLQACEKYLLWDAERNEHPGVKSALLSAADGCRHASMDYYVSLK